MSMLLTTTVGYTEKYYTVLSFAYIQILVHFLLTIPNSDHKKCPKIIPNDKNAHFNVYYPIYLDVASGVN